MLPASIAAIEKAINNAKWFFMKENLFFISDKEDTFQSAIKIKHTISVGLVKTANPEINPKITEVL